MEKIQYITKSDYVEFWKCNKHGYVKEYHSDELTEPSDYDKLVMEEGIKVGEVARELFRQRMEKNNETYVEVNRSKFTPAVCAGYTDAHMKNGDRVIAEASFIYKDCFCASDFVVKNTEGTYDIVEVKSAAEYKKEYTPDVAFQKYVALNAGYKINKTYVMYVNSAYVREKELDLEQLFVLKEVDVTPEMLAEVENNLKEIRAIAKEPRTVASSNCRDCDAFNHCYKDLPEHNVWTVSGSSGFRSAAKAYNAGLHTYEEVLKGSKDAGIKLNDGQIRQIKMELAKDNNVVVSVPDVIALLDKMYYPLYHLDFETVQDAIPTIEGYKPYEQRPFQYSLHIQKNENDITPEHKEYLQDELYDNTREIADRLVKDLDGHEGKGSIVSYSKFENRIIEALIEKLSKCADKEAKSLVSGLNNINSRLVDMAEIYQYGHVYARSFEGKWSIKKVFPGLCPEYANEYKSLPTAHNGTEAVSEYRKMVASAKGTPEHEQAYNGLLLYCGQDTRSEFLALDATLRLIKERATKEYYNEMIKEMNKYNKDKTK